MSDTTAATRPLPPGVQEAELDDALAAFAEAIGADKVATDADSLQDFQDPFQVPGDATNLPSAVVSPTSVDDVQAVVRIANQFRIPLWPISRGKNNGYGGAAPQVRGSVMLSFRNMNKVLEIDSDSGLARIQTGALGPDLEEQLNAKGWTIGHFPDSFTHSTLGGWIATRSSGMQSDKYGDISHIVRGVRVVRPGGVLVIPAIPSASTGPSVREMIVGSEGRLGDNT